MAKNKDIETLLAIDPSKVKAPALTAALKTLKEETEKKNAEKALAVLRQTSETIEFQLQRVRDIRKLEKVEMARLKAASEANEKFLEDGDVEALRKTFVSLGLMGIAIGGGF